MVADPAALRSRLLAAGARPGFRGMMVDRRFDRDGTLTPRDEVLRLRTFHLPAGGTESRLGWKGPAMVSPEGHKVRRELEYPLGEGTAPPEALLTALGYTVVQTIERFVEYFEAAGSVIRLEWYPRMDILVEVEGTEATIEAALALTGLPRAEFSADPLRVFADRYALRTGRPALLDLAALGGDPPAWALP